MQLFNQPAMCAVVEGLVGDLMAEMLVHWEILVFEMSCGKLTTGVSVKPWTGIFMLRNLKSPETYFQTAFRVQSPWTMTNPDGQHPNQVEILKKEC